MSVVKRPGGYFDVKDKDFFNETEQKILHSLLLTWLEIQAQLNPDRSKEEYNFYNVTVGNILKLNFQQTKSSAQEFLTRSQCQLLPFETLFNFGHYLVNHYITSNQCLLNIKSLPTSIIAEILSYSSHSQTLPVWFTEQSFQKLVNFK